MEDLKKCPFCGGEAYTKMKKRNFGFAIWCECKKCSARTDEYYPNMYDENNVLDNIDRCRDVAVRAWNRRVRE